MLVERMSFTQAFKGALLLKNKSITFIVCYSFCTWLVIMSFAGYWLKDYMMAVHKYSEGTSLGLVEIYWGAFLIASLGIGCFTGSTRVARINLLLLAVLGFITYTLMSIPLIFSYGEIVIITVMGGFSASGVIIAFSLLPQLVEPARCGTAVALNNTFIVLGGYVGQTLFGLVLKHINIFNYIKLNIPLPEPYDYSALLLYFIFTLLALIFAVLFVVKPLTKNKKSRTAINSFIPYH